MRSRRSACSGRAVAARRVKSSGPSLALRVTPRRLSIAQLAPALVEGVAITGTGVGHASSIAITIPQSANMSAVRLSPVDAFHPQQTKQLTLAQGVVTEYPLVPCVCSTASHR